MPLPHALQAFPYLSNKEFETAYAAGSLAAGAAGTAKGKRGRKRKAGGAEVRAPPPTPRSLTTPHRAVVGCLFRQKRSELPRLNPCQANNTGRFWPPAFRI